MVSGRGETRARGWPVHPFRNVSGAFLGATRYPRCGTAPARAPARRGAGRGVGRCGGLRTRGPPPPGQQRQRQRGEDQDGNARSEHRGESLGQEWTRIGAPGGGHHRRAPAAVHGLDGHGRSSAIVNGPASAAMSRGMVSPACRCPRAGRVSAACRARPSARGCLVQRSACQCPPCSAARPSACSFSRWAVSERAAAGCSAAGTSS